MLRRSGKSADSSEVAGPGWPPALVLALFVCGAFAFLGPVRLVIGVLLGKLYPSLALLVRGFVPWLAHSTCFVGLLRRRTWARLLAAGISLAWAALALRNLLYQVRYGHTTMFWEYLVLVGEGALLIALGVHYLRSKKISDFLTT